MNSVKSETLSSGEDPLWPRAAGLLGSHRNSRVALLGVPAHQTSISPTNANTTPAAVREALKRYSTYAWSTATSIESLTVFDAGDVESPDFHDGEQRVAQALQALVDQEIVIAVGGDNSITYSVARGLWGESITSAGLITVDAHHDLRDGMSNGSPVRRLVEAGLPGSHIAQIGIADFSNSEQYARRARDYQITVIPRSDLRTRSLADVVEQALGVAGSGSGSGSGPIHVDIDVDVCDRSVVPGCPAAAPGGISADELRQMCYLFGRDHRVGSIDFTEVDASADSPDGRTVRLVALCILEFLNGVSSR